MDINVKTIKFDATDKLQEFIQKKVGKLDKYCNDIRKVEVSLKVVKPETAMNKQASLTVVLPKSELFAEKICDTFEEAVMESLAAIEKQLGKYKEKQTNI
ncbi:MAG: ribosome-associated translation inhibitor RaiA [Bacteroidaceae bacterium]|jgi:putative sigma-54 modulation protein|nr:ribosome-associated translation inhibitor RaiA [Bacteroidaceae bacterium]MBO7580408.1 ribosome-associated translation inhibitor RaiA [Bacteroidaceae bacterium]